MHPASPGAQSSDPPGWRLAFHLLHEVGPGWLTVWLILIISGLVALGVVAGPWVPGAITAVAGLSASGATIAKRFAGKSADPTPVPPVEPDPALDPPPP